MCGRTSEFVELTRDHVMPLVMGGDDCIWNLQPLCKPCNGFKAGNWVKDFRSPEQMAVLETLLKVRRIAK
jgi:5-methylcytosine-specific restriction endonuclease McrA